jgi:hypothetical protein
MPRISFSPSLISLQPSSQEQTVNVTVSLQEPIISSTDIGLTIQFTSSISGITIPNITWPTGTEGVPDPITVILTVPPNQVGSGTNIITPTVITNSELYAGFVPLFRVNYMRPFSMRSLYSDNSLVYYKIHSLSSGTGSVRNSRARGRRT